jgi:hypothetical protein
MALCLFDLKRLIKGGEIVLGRAVLSKSEPGCIN